MELLNSSDKPKAAAVLANFLGDRVYATNTTGTSPISAKSNRIVFPCSSKPKLLSSMSDWLKMQ